MSKAVTNVEKKLIASMQQALEISRGEREPSRAYSLPIAPAPDAPAAREERPPVVTLSWGEYESLRRALDEATARAVRCEGVVPSKELLCRADGLLSLIYHRYRYEKIPDDVRENMLQTSYALRAITDRLP